ncbi:uncharacterized protein At1g24485-like [Syzygium oleosum]|uniref:uncharacterized protein At1g24485-like n=1 Tax=Syzygium oleosum TaxID=219896 RepID=UPI0011D184F0|nr:uncharacterized protein At1g24485-like [Syzygium oleosum]
MAVQMFLLMLLFIEVSLSQASLLRIDCGSQTGYEAKDGSYWSTDDEFVKVGNDMPISAGSFSKWTQLNTLRVFTKEKKVCYKLPAQPSVRYMSRATFYYGNYDGLSKPPTFDLEFDENNRKTVVTSNTDPQIYELIYTSGADDIKVCLIRTSDAQFPFINALELWPLDDNMYDGMTRDMAWLSNYRYDYGAVADTVDDWILGYPTDSANRIWVPTTPSDLNQTKASATYFYDNGDNNVPNVVMSQMVEAPNLTYPISLSFSINDGINLVHYVTAYFTETHSLNENESRSFEFNANNKFVSTMNPRYEYCTSVWAFVQSNGTLNVQLRASGNSTLPPLISAIEVYTGQAVHYPKTSKWKEVGGGGGGVLFLILIGCGYYLCSKSRNDGRPNGGGPNNGVIEEAPPRRRFWWRRTRYVEEEVVEAHA